MDKLEEINETVAVETAQETIIEQDPLIELDIEEQATFIQDDDEDDELKIYGENGLFFNNFKNLYNYNNNSFLKPHNRFEYPEYSKKMVALNPNSYHRLGLSLTDTYVFDGIY